MGDDCDVTHLKAPLGGDGQPLLVARAIEDREHLWRRIPKAHFSEERQGPTQAAFRDQDWDDKATKKGIRKRCFGDRAELSDAEKKVFEQEYEKAKAAREISANVAEIMLRPACAVLLEGKDRRATDYVVELDVKDIREGAALRVAHTPIAENISHADIVGNYEQMVEGNKNVRMEARLFLAHRSRVRHRPGESA